ncbi:hypothetical protein [Clostridium felsineum]|uniref:Uncharacterized protein n=1 Tax=Clostridium felsineum TaxID=36839 RepID=A0A1S8M7R8_9CLOT|nr:hypothetical protein CLROS_032660 [Clostridium felsineum]URZ12935.1 hypothetical protein CROST_036810 [Clostridium felsineum]
MKRKLIIGIIAAVFTTVNIACLKSNVKANAPANMVGVTYQGHVQNIGWQGEVSNGQEAGTDGQALRVEALKLKLNNAPEGAHIEYQTHVQNIGWQGWVQDGAEAGTDGQSLRVEAIQIKLKNMPGYSIEYRAHVQNVGWQDWVSDGQEAGTDGKALRVEALEIRIVRTSDNTTVGVAYAGHVQNVGWQQAVENGQVSGTEGQALRVEALKLNLNNAPVGAHIKYQTHVQNIGWQSPVEDGIEAGTDGKSLRVEAVKIALEDMPGYSVQYRAHVENVGWQDWKSDGQEAGTDGKALRVEAIEVRIVKTKDNITPTPQPFINDDTVTPDNPTKMQPDTKSMNTDFTLSDQLNAAMGKTKTPTGTIYGYNNGKQISGDVFNSIDIDGNKTAIQLMTTDEMKADIESAYNDNNGGLYTANGNIYKVVNVYKEYSSTSGKNLDSLKAAAEKLNTQFLTSGFDSSQTFDRFYVNTDGSGTYWVDRVVAYFTNK